MNLLNRCSVAFSPRALISQIFLLCLGACLIFSACRTASPEVALHRYEFKSAHMGTAFTIVLYAPDTRAASEAATAAFQRIADLDDIMSDYKADSELNLLSGSPVGIPVPLSQQLYDVLRRSEHISSISNGAFDFTVGPYVRLWRFARKRKVLPTPEEVATARASVGWQKLRIDAKNHTATVLVTGMRLDLGGIAKGYAADQALKELRARGICHALVAASGDIAIGDPPPGEPGWKIGISGLDSASASSTLLLRNCGISTSGDTEQYIEIAGVRYSHIVNPATGLGLTERIQVTIIAPDATSTDGLATAVSVLGREAGLRVVERQSHTASLIIVSTSAGKLEVFPSKRFKHLPKSAEAASANVR
jgi:thiamine biosynthesis lipoprotein